VNHLIVKITSWGAFSVEPDTLRLLVPSSSEQVQANMTTLMARIMKLVSLVENLLEMIENSSITMTNRTLENVLTCLRVRKKKVHLLQMQSQLLIIVCSK
jgi:hypothetical protein